MHTLITLLAILLTILCTSFAQIFQKKAALQLQSVRDAQAFSAWKFAFNPSLLFSLVLLGVGFISWLFVLSRWDVSTAYPFLSLNLVLIMLLSQWIFSETTHSRQWVGAFAIVSGVLLISGGGFS